MPTDDNDAPEPIELTGEQVQRQVVFSNAIGVPREGGGAWEAQDFADPPDGVSAANAFGPGVLWVARSRAQIQNTWVTQYLDKVTAVFKKFATQPGGPTSKPSPAIPRKELIDWIKHNNGAPDVVKDHGNVPTATADDIDALRNRLGVNAFNAAVSDFGNNDWFDDPL